MQSHRKNDGNENSQRMTYWRKCIASSSSSQLNRTTNEMKRERDGQKNEAHSVYSSTQYLTIARKSHNKTIVLDDRFSKRATCTQFYTQDEKRRYFGCLHFHCEHRGTECQRVSADNKNERRNIGRRHKWTKIGERKKNEKQRIKRFWLCVVFDCSLAHRFFILLLFLVSSLKNIYTEDIIDNSKIRREPGKMESIWKPLHKPGMQWMY